MLVRVFVLTGCAFFMVQTRNDDQWMKHTISYDIDGKVRPSNCMDENESLSRCTHSCWSGSFAQIKLDYRPVHFNTLDEKEQASFPAKARTY